MNVTRPLELPPPSKAEEPEENGTPVQNSANEAAPMTLEEYLINQTKIVYGNLMMNKFAGLGGFNALFNVIYNEPARDGNRLDDRDDFTESEASPVKKAGGTVDKLLSAEKPLLRGEKDAGGAMIENIENVGSSDVPAEKAARTTLCPWLVIDGVLKIFEELSDRFTAEYGLQIAVELTQRVFGRIRAIRDREIKELDIDLVKKVLDKLGSFVASVKSEQHIAEFNELRERNELELYFRFLDGQSFEKKLKGLNGIRDYVNRIDVGNWPVGDTKIARKPLVYFTSKEFTRWVLDKKVIEMIYEKYPHIELIKRSVDIQKFIAEHGGMFPDNLVDIIWHSSFDKHEDMIKIIYEKIVEVAPCLNLRAAQRMYSKFLTVRMQDYNEDFVDLISKFTQKALSLVIKRIDNGVLEMVQVPEEQREHLLFGVPLMFDLIMDESTLDMPLSQRVLWYLQEIASIFPSTNIFFPIVDKCMNNLTQDRSVYQSLVIMKEFFNNIEDIPVYEPILEAYFQKFAETYDIINYLVKDICLYSNRVRERMRAIRSVTRREIGVDDEDFQDESFVGKFSHKMNIMERLQALKYFSAHQYLKNNHLSTDHVRCLWKVFVLEPNFIFETKTFLALISKLYMVQKRGPSLLVAAKDVSEVLLDILCNEEVFEISNLTLEKFSCLEFFFLCVNIYEAKVMPEQKEEDNIKIIINSKYIKTSQENLTGLDFLWKCLIGCPEGILIDRVSEFLVDLYTRLDNDLKQKSQEIYQNLIKSIMGALEQMLEQNNVQAIERYIQLLAKFLDRLDNKKTIEYYRSLPPLVTAANTNATTTATTTPINASNYQQMMKVHIAVDFQPYNIPKLFDFLKKDRVGTVKETLARAFEVDSDDFDLVVDDVVITEEDLIKEIKDVYKPNSSNVSVRMIKKDPRPVNENKKYLVTQNRAYIDVFFKIFSRIDAGNVFYSYNYYQKL